MIKLGITGDTGSGKTFCAKKFEELGVPVFYSDDIAKKLLNESLPLKMSISKGFGKMYDENGKLLIDSLREIVFSEKSGDNIKKLNSIVHPHVFKEYEKFCEEHKSERYTIIESAILYEIELDKMLDNVIYVDVAPDIRMARALKRSGIKKKEYIQRMKNQISPDIKIAKSYYILYNNPYSIDIDEQILEIHNFINYI